MKDEEFQLDSAENKNTLLTNMFTGTGLFHKLLIVLLLVIGIYPHPPLSPLD